MSDLQLSRSVRFVSLDTHPANNSLVVTYEILVTVADPETGQQLARRNKRDQFQVTVSALDGLSLESATAAGHQSATPNWLALAEEILAKCPVLSDTDRAQTLENLQLNLLYLFKRKLQTGSQQARPPSSESARARFGAPSVGGRLASARQGSAPGPRRAAEPTTSNLDSSLEIYQFYCEKELKQARDPLDYGRLDEFLGQLDEHLLSAEQELRLESAAKTPSPDIETQLEGLYGDPSERLHSIAVIRRLVRGHTQHLASISSNRLLVCVMLRTLRDSDSPRDRRLSESILFCLLRLSSFEDLLTSMVGGSGASASGGSDPVDLVRVSVDLLDNHLRWLSNKSETDSRPLATNFYYTNSLFVLLANLLRADSDENKHKFKRKLIQQHGAKLADVVAASFVLISRHLARDIRSPRKRCERVGVTLMQLLRVSKEFSRLKEFVVLVRVAPRLQALVESLTCILSALQLCRPGSGSSQQGQQLPVSDRVTLCETFELEMELLKLTNNLIYDARMRTRFMRKNLLLKCVLRSLVVFLAASRKSNSLKPYDRSCVLLAPFKCLYELSCTDKIKRELFKSKIIIRCLLEYLISSSSDLETELGLVGCQIQAPFGSSANNKNAPLAQMLDLNQEDQIVLDGLDANQYIVSLWINLSARPEAPFYSREQAEADDLGDFIWDYMRLASSNLLAFARLMAGHQSVAQLRPALLKDLHLMNYIHAKLLRNLSQFFVHERQPSEPEGSFWTDKLTLALNMLLELDWAQSSGCFLPLTVECLATLGNWTEQSGDQLDQLDVQTSSLLARLFGERRPLASLLAAGEHDDLLLVAVNLLGSLARTREICAALEPIQSNLVSLFDCLLETKQNDPETLVSCLFTLTQLANHCGFLRRLVSLLDCVQVGQRGASEAMSLVGRLSSLLLHPDLAVVRLANSTLSSLKQLEELQSLADSFAGQQRFVAYNQKWLQAISANRDDASDELALLDTERGNSRDGAASGRASESELMLDSDYSQLRAVNEAEPRDPSSRATTSSSSVSFRPRAKGVGGGHDLDEPEEDLDEDEDEEETMSEPDLNVIDANSMIRHLTHRRRYRDELAKR